MAMYRMSGRNAMCHCGSGRKFKHCCLHTTSDAARPIVPKAIATLEMKVAEKRLWQNKYGNVTPVIHADWNGEKWIAVGNELHHSSKWKTFADFLAYYIKSVLTPSWGNEELLKTFSERHPILQWYDRSCRLQTKQAKEKDGLFAVIPNGAMHAYYLIAYDLYTLRHHSTLQESLIARIKNKDQFQGARHELFAAATCIRAGFEIEYENERDGSRRHTEFVAKHKFTSQRINVEAKSRHRKGVLGQPGDRTADDQVRVRIRSLINDAIGKPVQFPYVIFLDLNLPPSSPRPITEDWFRRIASPILDDRKNKGDSDPWTLLVFSNFPDHYVDDDGPAPIGYAVGMLGKNPPQISDHPENITAILDAALKFGNIPTRFEEMQLT